ncbi:MAG: PKD domain-containing protein, partial [Opitutaceae bacterium]|nr:PKD domain-containing protein [Cytophagales bacterium]
MKKFLLSLTIGLGLSALQFLSAQTNSTMCDATFKEDFSLHVEPERYPSGFYRYFAANGTGSFTWDFGDNSTPEYGSFVKHHFNENGTYKVKLTVQRKYAIPLDNGMADALCLDSSIQYIEVNQCNASYNTTDYYSKTYPIQYSGTTLEAVQKGQNNYLWDFGDGSQRDTGSIVKHSFPKPGKYYISLGVSSLAKDTLSTPCKSFKGEWIIIGGQITSDSTSPGNCQTFIKPEILGTSVIFSDRLMIDYFNNAYQEFYNWDFGDGTSGSGRNIKHQYEKPGQYIAVLKKEVYFDPCPETINGIRCMAVRSLICSSTQTFNIDMGNTATCSTSIRYSADGLKVSFSQDIEKIINNDTNSIIAPYKFQSQKLFWNYGDGTTDTTSDYFAVHNYKTAGEYTAKLTRISGLPFYLVDPRESTPGGFGFNSIMPGGCVVIITPCTSFAEIQVKVTEEEVKKCKSYFDWSLDGDKLKLKSNTSGDNIGFARLDFGDGDWTETNGNLISTAHTYTQPGTYEICLQIATVSDSVLPYVRLASYCSDTYCQSVVVGT